MLLAPTIGFGSAANQASGNGSGRIHPFAEVDVLDAIVAPFALTPSTSDPGPRAFSTSDGFTFSNGDTNVRSVLSLDVTSATNGAAAATVVVQGTTHTIADWFYAAQDSGTAFTTVRAVGAFDSSAASYATPPSFTKSSQGTVTLRRYTTPSPSDNGATLIVNWVYDATPNKYLFDAADKDFTNGNGEATVWPLSVENKADYTFSGGGNSYAITSVANAGSNYVPTVQTAWNIDWSNQASVSKDAFVLVDVPAGAPRDAYSYTLTATITRTKT